MKRFAFYGRVSTEDQQDPGASRGWQLARARALIEPHGGEIVVEFFDEGQSRSLPWKRRPAATSLLAALRDPGRGFEAIVVGEPARAFSGNQFSLTFPLLEHYGVELWVPEVGGRVDPGSEAHDLVMNLFGGMSKGERVRIKTRVRAAMGDQAAREGRFLGGRPPYGYQLGDAGPHPNPGKAAAGQRAHRLEPDRTAAPIVARIFAEYLSGRGLFAIAEGLTRDRVPSPSAHDPARNRHREGRAWSKWAIRAILTNPRYTGHQVWNRQRRDEVLVDLDDVAAGYDSKMRWNERADWIWSAELAHEPLVSADDFVACSQHLGAGTNRPATRKPRSTPRPYVLRGLLFCGLCGRKMQGQLNHGRPHYRCRYPSEYALANKVDHPRTVYLREDVVLPPLDRWLAGVFDPDRIDATCAQLAAASDSDEAYAAELEANRRRLVDCDGRLAKYRAALEGGADPTVVAAWTREVQAERAAVERSLAQLRPQRTLSAAELREIVEELADIPAVLAEADPELRARLYGDLGIALTYRPGEDLVTVAAVPACVRKSVSEGGLEPPRPCGH